MKSKKRCVSMLSMAIKYAELGWPVFPLHNIVNGKCTCGKEKCASAGKHPRTRHGFKDATINIETIKEFFVKWPDANIGIATGEVSGLVVIDIDPRNGGDSTYSSLIEKYGPMPETIMVNTGGGGQHVYLKYEKGLKGGNNKLGKGVDVKSDNGYVVAPPSNHILGVYDWREGSLPDTTELAMMPKAISELLSQKKNTEYLIGESIIEGERNNYLASIAGKLRAKGKDRKYIQMELLKVNYEKCSPPLISKEVVGIARSICKYEIGKTTLLHIWRDCVRSDKGPSGKSMTSMRHLLVNLSFYMNNIGENCYPTIEILVQETGYSKAHISRVLTEAQCLGWIDKISYKGVGQAWRNTVYKPKLPDKVLLTEQHLIERYCPEGLKVLSRKQIKHQ